MLVANFSVLFLSPGFEIKDELTERVKTTTWPWLFSLRNLFWWKVQCCSPLTESGLSGRAVEYPSTTFHHSCLALLKFDAEDQQSGGRAAREQTLDLSQRSWMPAQHSEAQEPAGLLEQPSRQVPTAWRTPSRRDEGGKFCPACEAGNNKMSHGAAPESANQQVMEMREFFRNVKSLA